MILNQSPNRPETDEVYYREAETVMGFMVDNAMPYCGYGRVVNETVSYPRIASIFAPDLPTSVNRNVDAPIVREIQTGSFSDGDFIVIDGQSLSIKTIIKSSEFASQYRPITGTASFWGKDGGPRQRVTLDRSEGIAFADGRPVDDLVALSRGRIRDVGSRRMIADLPISVQSTCFMLTLGGTMPLPFDLRAQLAHTALLGDHAAAQAADLPAPVHADISFFYDCMEGGDRFPIRKTLSAEDHPDATYDIVAQTAAAMKDSQFLRGLCRTIGHPMTLFSTFDELSPDEQAALEKAFEPLPGGTSSLPQNGATASLSILATPGTLRRLAALIGNTPQQGEAAFITRNGMSLALAPQSANTFILLAWPLNA